jgi:Cu/Ag efflux pump CusA
VIGGLIVATVTTLVFVPCVFAIVHGGGKGRPQAQTRSPA